MPIRVYSADPIFQRMLILEIRPLFPEPLPLSDSTPPDRETLCLFDADAAPLPLVRKSEAFPNRILLSSDPDCPGKEKSIAFFLKPFLVTDLISFLSGFRRQPAFPAEEPSSGLARLTEKNLFLLDGLPLSLSEKEKRLLLLLWEKRGETVPAEELRKALGETGSGESNSLAVYINFLRKKLQKENAPPLIKTVRGVGYRLN